MDFKGGKDKIKKIEKVDDGFIVDIGSRRLHLKKVGLKESEILFINEVIEHSVKNGFNNIVVFEILSDGKPYIKYENELYILTDIYSFVDIKKDINSYCLASLLANFHTAAGGFTARDEIKPSVTWGKRTGKYRNFYTMLDKFIDEISEKSRRNEFEEKVVSILGELKTRCKGAMKAFRSIEYFNLLELSMKKKEIVLYDIGKQTLAELNGKYYIYDVFDLSYGLIEEDLAMLIKKTNRENKDKIIDIYSKNSPRQINLNILEAYLNFPENTLKVICEYMRQKDANLVAKLQRASIKDDVR
ncbi:MAG: hypothetical protein JG776_1675 [Caloramator sp.]|jgi:CotS family spore coat protein|uniref:hypothetical protein n=1 Tax=Caloramator sp. TaxID=1871330 RepID=UPI001D3D7CCE|nr:hypothetical protein [Caloramator sp.]MBZ4663960.1 hypothetical protein [Caloramator sp.]